MVVVIILVIILCGVENGEKGDLRYDRFVIRLILIQFISVVFRFLFLFFGVIKDGAAILRANIVPLAVQCSRVVRFPEYFQ